jgi:hypothetical protein
VEVKDDLALVSLTKTADIKFASSHPNLPPPGK